VETKRPEVLVNMKGRTEEEPPDPIKDMDDRRPDGSVGHECLGGGKHEGVQESSMMELLSSGPTCFSYSPT